jgi:signal transduction histidine kinase
VLDDHQPHEPVDRHRRAPVIASRFGPRTLHRLKQRRITQQPVEHHQIARQLPHPRRQHLIEQRLHLPTRQPQHHDPL